MTNDNFPALPPPAARTLFHTRQTQFQGYQRADGLWDVEAQMVDTKPFDFDLPSSAVLPTGAPLHHMLIRLTFDANLTVVDIASSMASYPHAVCAQADRHMQRMVGCNMAKGWRKAIEENLGKIEGCSHMRELLFNMATVAYQTLAPVAIAQYQKAQQEGLLKNPPAHLGQCHAYDRSGPVVRAHYPMFFEPKA